MKMATVLYALALVLLPFSYAIKGMFFFLNIPWVDPSLVLGLIAFVLTKAPMNDKRALWIVGWAFLSASIGSFFLPVTAHTIDRQKSPLYILYVEPVRLALTVIWFWVSIKFFALKQDFVIRWLAIAVIFQLSLAIYLYLNLYNLTPVPDTVALYMYIYGRRQAIWFGDTPLYRMGGTFDESPPFGLFMLSCFVIFALWLVVPANAGSRSKKWAVWGAAASCAGAIASLSDQVLLALTVFGATWYAVVRKRVAHRSALYKATELIVVGMLVLGTSIYTASRLLWKAKEAASYDVAKTTDVIGTAGAERSFHLRYGMGLLGEVPLAIWTGIGPGRYGDYAFRTGLFPPTVTIQNMPLDWLVEYGLFGTGLICAWLWNVLGMGRRAYGWLATVAMVALVVAAISQGNWLWEAWFLALAFLYSARDNLGPWRARLPNRPHVPAMRHPFC